MILLIKSGEMSGTSTYQSLVSRTFGFPGYMAVSALQFLYPFAGTIILYPCSSLSRVHGSALYSTATISLRLGSHYYEHLRSILYRISVRLLIRFTPEFSQRFRPKSEPEMVNRDTDLDLGPLCLSSHVDLAIITLYGLKFADFL